jgi:hypothetical protein
MNVYFRFLFAGFAWAVLMPKAASEELLREWEVDRSWSAHPSSPPILVTAGSSQYLAYYNAERRLTLAWRRLDADVWQLRHFPVVTRWATGGHALIGLAVDRTGVIHLVPYRRDLSEQPEAPPNMIYFRSARPHDPHSMEATHMVSPGEPNPSYPVFLTDKQGTLYFEYREGGSGSGSQRINRYDPQTRIWEPMATLLDGRGKMSAYGGPRLGPDGRWHCLWMWRDTPSADTNHTLSYMVSPDLRTWKSACGKDLALPVNSDNPFVVIDPAKPKEGLLNPLQWLGFDSRKRPVAAYHIYAPCGNSAIYVARFEKGGWKRVAAHVWGFRWDFGGGGAISCPLGAGPVKPAGNGQLELQVWSEREGRRRIILDEATLAQIDDSELEPEPETAASGHRTSTWRSERSKAEIDFPLRPMSVQWLPDQGGTDEAGIHYEVRWEAGPVNHGDRPVPEPWPEPTPLRVFKLREK